MEHIARSFVASLTLDLSTVGYIAVVPFLLVALADWVSPTQGKWPRTACLYFQQLVILSVVLICLGNILMYADWQTLLNRRALSYLSEPMGMIQSLSVAAWLVALVTIVFCTYILWRLLAVRVHRLFQPISGVARYIWLLTASPLLLLMIRGGFGTMPVNESNAFYSNQMMLNHAATNPVWHLVHTLIERRSTVNPFAHAVSTDFAVGQFFEPIDTASTPLTGNDRCNVVLVMMESMTAQIVECVGGMPGVTPALNEVARQGLVFDSIYSSGYRTDQGLAALLSGYPAQPDQSVILHEDKTRALPSLPKQLKKLGYRTFAWYGGDLNFANMGAYFYHLGFDHIVGKKEFAASTPTQNWGIPDHLLFKRVHQDLDKTQEPFFAFVQTLSLHRPYDTPGNSLPESAPVAERFLASARYADASVDSFLREAETKPWYANTLFVFVADHGVAEPGNLGLDMPLARKVPLIVAGPALAPAWRGKKLQRLGNHHDLTTTLCEALGADARAFRWSRSLMKEYALPFAMYCNENGAGWITPSAVGFYRLADQYWYAPYGNLPDSTTRLQALQYLYSQYADYLAL